MSRRTVLNRSKALLLLAPVLLLTGCSQVSGLGFEEGVTSVNDQSLSLWQGAWIAGGVVGVITLVLILWPAIFHRGKKDDPSFPKQTQYNVPVEVAYTIIPFIIVAVLFYYTAQKQTIITEKTTTYAHEITVEGFQWSWQFGYPDAGPKALITGTPEQTPTMCCSIGRASALHTYSQRCCAWFLDSSVHDSAAKSSWTYKQSGIHGKQIG